MKGLGVVEGVGGSEPTIFNGNTWKFSEIVIGVHSSSRA